MRIVAVVPMKLNNVRLQQKNTKCFKHGHPLCWYILSTLLKSEFIDDIFVYCSNEDIKKYIPDGVRYLKRDSSLDLDTTKMNEVLQKFSQEVEADIYVMTHATAPFVSIESVNKGIIAVKDEGYDSAFAVKKLQDFIWKDGKPFNYKLNEIPRTQDLEPLYVETSGFYIYKKNVIQGSGRRIGDNPCLIEVNEIESCDIDEYEDFMIADAIQYYKQGEVYE
jgi:CMP-N-acetylneuraminic acid synthetase